MRIEHGVQNHTEHNSKRNFNSNAATCSAEEVASAVSCVSKGLESSGGAPAWEGHGEYH